MEFEGLEYLGDLRTTIESVRLAYVRVWNLRHVEALVENLERWEGSTWSDHHP